MDKLMPFCHSYSLRIMTFIHLSINIYPSIYVYYLHTPVTHVPGVSSPAEYRSCPASAYRWTLW